MDLPLKKFYRGTFNLRQTVQTNPFTREVRRHYLTRTQIGVGQNRLV